MADFDAGEVQEEQAKPKPKPKPKAKGGGGGPVVIIAAVVALAALGVAVFMFLQFQSLKAKMMADTGENPPGTPAEAQAAEGEGDGHGAGDTHTVQAVREEPEEIIYRLGEFTGNTSDGRFAKMDISLELVSYFNAADWEVYESQLEMYHHDLKFWQDYQNGKIDPMTGKYLKEDHAYLPTGPIPAAHGGGAPAFEPPEKPEEPARPLSRMERELQKQDALVRSVVIDQINTHTAVQLTSPAGKDEFKQALITSINGTIPAHVGKVEDVYFSQLVTT